MSAQLDYVKTRARRAFRWITGFILGVLVLIALGYFTCSQLSYSDGYRSGQLVKISRKGMLFKTYEGTLNLSPEGMMTIWDFSAKNGTVARQLENMDGKLVRVHYQQRYKKFFWQGDTEYIVDEVQASSQQ